MKEIKLDLFENAIDSLNEALAKYKEGNGGNEKAYKFCVQHLSHFLELILKYYVTQSHPLLIYKDPFAKIINEKSQTIGLFEAINFLKNEGHVISDNFKTDIDWLKKLRNDIEHHKFSMNVDEVERTIGRLIRAVVEFDESHRNINFNLVSYISADQYNLFHELANTYEHRLKKAEEEVEALEDNISVYHCYECDHNTMIPDEDSSTGYRCTFCGNEESYDIEVECSICGCLWPTGQMLGSEDGEYICPHHKP